MARGIRNTALVGVALVACLAANPTMAGDDKKAACLKKFKITGYPHRIRMIAELNAIRAWATQSEKKGADYALWHNARRSELSCARLKGSLYYRCTAAGRPCLSRHAIATQ